MNKTKMLLKKIWYDPVWSKVIAALLVGIGLTVKAILSTPQNRLSLLDQLYNIVSYGVPLYVILILICLVIAWLIIFKTTSSKIKGLLNTQLRNFTYAELASLLMQKEVQVPENLQDRIQIKTLYDLLPYFRIAFHQKLYVNSTDPELQFASVNTSLLRYYGLIELVSNPVYQSPNYFKITELGIKFLDVYDQIQLSVQN